MPASFLLSLALAIHAENDQNVGMIRSMVTTKCRFLRIGELPPQSSDGILSFLPMRYSLLGVIAASVL